MPAASTSAPVRRDRSAATIIRRGLVLALVALAAWLCVRIVLGWLAPDSLWEPVTLPAAQTATTVGAAQAYNFSTDPFRLTTDTPDAVPALNTDAPETTLNLVLKGRRAGENGVAFIRTPDGREDNIYVDQAVMNGVILRGVFADHVLLEVNGQVQRLTLEDAKAAARTGATSGQTAPGRTLSTLKALDAQTLMQQVQLIPALSDTGQRVGVQLKPRSSAVNLSDYGLQSSDIITAIAGQSLVRGLPDPAAIMRAASSGRAVTVDLIRDGAPLTITVEAQ